MNSWKPAGVFAVDNVVDEVDDGLDIDALGWGRAMVVVVVDVAELFK